MISATPLLGKCCGVTGETCGIGLATACRLVEKDADAISVGRDAERGLAAKRSTHEAAGCDGADFLQAGRSDLEAVRSIAGVISNRPHRHRRTTFTLPPLATTLYVKRNKFR